MAKYFSFIAENVTPVSQNSRRWPYLVRLRNDCLIWYNQKYPGTPLPVIHKPTELEAKLFYIHRKYDKKDADNISKPFWDSFNTYAYDDDRQIKYLETLKIDVNTLDILELDVTNLDQHDCDQLIDFLLNPAPTKERILYVAISDYQSKKVRLV